MSEEVQHFSKELKIIEAAILKSENLLSSEFEIDRSLTYQFSGQGRLEEQFLQIQRLYSSIEKYKGRLRGVLRIGRNKNKLREDIQQAESLIQEIRTKLIRSLIHLKEVLKQFHSIDLIHKFLILKTNEEGIFSDLKKKGVTTGELESIKNEKGRKDLSKAILQASELLEIIILSESAIIAEESRLKALAMSSLRSLSKCIVELGGTDGRTKMDLIAAGREFKAAFKFVDAIKDSFYTDGKYMSKLNGVKNALVGLNARTNTIIALRADHLA